MRINRSVAIGAVTAMMAIALPLLTLPASAASNPPWEPDPQALGTLSFFNASGQQVFGGNNLANLFAYAEASSADTTGGTKATMTFAAPAPGVPTGTWFTAVASGATNFPNASAPAPLNTSPNPVVSLTSIDGNLTNFIAQVPAQTQTGYANVFQIRVSTSGLPGTGTGTSSYWDADVMVNTVAGTWSEIYPQTGPAAVTTTTGLQVAPQPSAQQGASVTLTATVAAADSTHPAGTVQFAQDGFNVGAPVPVSTTDGTAVLSTTALLPSAPLGTVLTAAFTPTSSTYTGSASSSVDYTVNPVANVPTIAGPHQAGQKETCTDGSLDFGVTASYTWLANGVSIGTGASLTVPGTAYKKALACQATVHDGTGPASAPMTSTPVTVILGKALKPSKNPTLSGLHKAGTLETVHAGTWPRGAKFTYQWLLNGRVIRGATRTTLRLVASERGKRISCRVTAHLTGFANGVATTASVTVR